MIYGIENKSQNIFNKLPNTERNAISILSGGLDSTILLYLLKKKYNDKVIALTFNYGQKHNVEIEKAKITCDKTNTPHKIINIEFLGDIVSPVSSLVKDSSINVPDIKEVLGDPSPSTYIPYRNLLFTSLALSFAESNNADVLFLGIQSHDLYGYWDTTEEFINRLNKITELSRMFPIKVEAPFVHLSKKDEILIGKELNVPFEDTWSCYNGKETACGTCGTCAERIKNFIDAKVVDPIKYEKDIKWDELIKLNFQD